MSSLQTQFTRKVRTARKVWECACCPDPILPGVDYCEDTVVLKVSHSGAYRNIGQNRWHLWCAPYNRKEAQALVKVTN